MTLTLHLSAFDRDTRGAQTALSYGFTVLFAALLVTMSMTAMTDYVSDKTTDAKRGQAQVVADRTASKVMSADHFARQAPDSSFKTRVGLSTDIRGGTIQIMLRSNGGNPYIRVRTPGGDVERRIDIVTSTPVADANVTTNEPIYVVYNPAVNTITIKEQDEL